MKARRHSGARTGAGLAALVVVAVALTAWAWQNPRLTLELVSQAWSCL